MMLFFLNLILSMRYLFFLHFIGLFIIVIIVVCEGIYKLEKKENLPLQSILTTIFFYLYLLIILFFNTKWIFQAPIITVVYYVFLLVMGYYSTITKDQWFATAAGLAFPTVFTIISYFLERSNI
jgi:hypothetical protein